MASFDWVSFLLGLPAGALLLLVILTALCLISPMEQDAPWADKTRHK